MKKSYFMSLVIFFTLMTISASVWSVTLCLARPRTTPMQFCNICIEDVIRGEVTNQRAEDTEENISPNPAQTVWSNANERFTINSSMAYSMAPLVVTNGNATLRNGESVTFNNCTVNTRIQPTPEDRRIRVNGATEATTVSVQIYSGRGGNRIYSCTGESIGAQAWVDNAIRILIDGLVKELRCNVGKTIGTLLGYASRVFVILFWIDCLWSFAAWVTGGGRDLQNFIKVLVRKILFFGFFYWMLTMANPVNFFEDGSWIGRTLQSMQGFGMNLITGENNTVPVIADLRMAPGTGVPDLADFIRNDTLFLRDYDTNVRLGLSPATVMMYGFSLQGAILSAVAQGILFNLPAIIAGLVVGFFTFGFVTTFVIRFLLFFIALGLITSFMAMITMVVIGGQILVAMIEMYMICGMAVILMGFGGSRWTVDNVSKYMGYVLITGLKMMMLIVVFVISILTTYGWISKLMMLAGGGAGNPAAAILDSLNPVSIILKIFEAMVVYAAIIVQSFILFGIAMRSADFTVGLIGGSPILSAGQMVKAGMAGMNAATYSATSITHAAGTAMTAVGGLLGNTAQGMQGMGGRLSQAFHAGQEGRSMSTQGLHDAHDHEESGADGHHLSPPPPAGGAAGAKAAGSGEGGGKWAQMSGKNKDWSDKNVAQKGLTVAGVAAPAWVGAGAVAGIGVAGGVGAAVGGGAAAGILAYKGGKAVVKGLTTYNPEGARNVGATLVRGPLTWAAKKAGKMVGPRGAPGHGSNDPDRNKVNKIVGAASNAGLTHGHKPLELGTIRSTGGKSTGSGKPQAPGVPLKNNPKAKRAALIATAAFTGGASLLLGAAHSAHKQRQKAKGEQPAGTTPEKPSSTVGGKLHTGMGKVMNTPMSAVLALRGGVANKLTGGSFKEGAGQGWEKSQKEGMVQFKESSNKEGVGAVGNWARDVGKMASKDKHNIAADFKGSFGSETYKVKSDAGTVKSLDAVKGSSTQFTLKTSGGETMQVEKTSISGKTAYQTSDGKMYQVGEDGKKLSQVELHQTGPKSYQTLGLSMSQAHADMGGGKAGFAAAGAVGVAKGSVAAIELASDTLKGAGGVLRGVTSEAGFMGRTSKTIGDFSKKISGNPLMNDRPAEGFALKPSFDAPRDDD